MAWMRMMGMDSVDYHEHTVAGRGDDPVAAARDYYASRGETPMSWGGSGRLLLGLDGEVDLADYRAVFGVGGAHDPRTGRRLVGCRRPGLELVVSPPKSVAELGVIGRAEDMHEIVDAERDATLDYLDRLVAERGRAAGTRTDPGGHRRADLGDLPARDDPGRRSAGARSRADRERRVHARRPWRLERRRHGVLARPPARGDGGRAHGRRRQGGRARLRDRGRPGAVGPARRLGDRRHPGRGVRDPLHPLGPDHRRGRP